MESEMKKAVIYARIASRNPVPADDRAFTVAGQERTCREYAKAKGFEVVAMFDDIGSGNVVERPGVLAMIAFLAKQDEPHVVLVQDRSRIGRSAEAAVRLRSAIAQVGATLESPEIKRGQDEDGKRLGQAAKEFPARMNTRERESER